MTSYSLLTDVMQRPTKLLAICIVSASAGLTQETFAAEGQDDGVLGWWYYAPGSDNYVADPVEACRRTAQNHMGTPLLDIRPGGLPGLIYECKYQHFLAIGGSAWYGTTSFSCKPGYVPRSPGLCVRGDWEPNEPSVSLSCSAGLPGYAVANPVVVSTGAKVQTETDFQGTPAGALKIKRSYRTMRRSGDKQSGGMGWSFSFDSTMKIESYGGKPQVVTGFLGDGTFFKFSWYDTYQSFRPTYNKSSVLVPSNANNDEWLLTINGKINKFAKRTNNDGTRVQFLLVSSQTIEGVTEYYEYDPTTLQLKTISDAFGRMLQISWGAENVVTAITSATGMVRFEYDSPTQSNFPSSETLARLVGVEYLDSSGVSIGTKRYHYENDSKPYLLTGITDENGKRYANYSYDSMGRATLSEHALGVNRHTFSYPDSYTRVITDPLGNARNVGLELWNGFGLVKTQSQPGGSGCSPGVKTYRYNELAGTRSEVDFNGNKTCYLNDKTRGLEVNRISGYTAADACPENPDLPLAKPNSRRIATKWHPDFSVRAAVAEPNLITTYTYNGQLDAEGRLANCAPGAALLNGKPIALLCATTVQATSDANGERGFAAVPVGLPRTTRYTYDAKGKLLSETGPSDSRGQSRGQVRSYYTDTTSTHFEGDLASIASAGGDTVEFLEYNLDGIATHSRYANGQTEHRRYDVRQRLLGITTTDTAGTVESNDFEYDPAGNLVRATAPDGATVRWNYDAAHRMTDVSDDVGNTIHYDLDAIGNVLKETGRDAGGNLAWEITRSFDALGRLQRKQTHPQDTGETIQYDRNGNLTVRTDRLGRSNMRSYDAFDRVVREVLPAPGPNAARPTVDYGYNHQNLLTSVTDPRSLVTRYKRDAFSQQIEIVSPDTGTSSVVIDNSGEMELTRDARGVVTTFAYDAAGRLTRSGTSQFEYGEPGSGAAGLLTTMQDDSGRTGFTYDGFGRLLSRTQDMNNGLETRRLRVSYTYGNSGNETGRLTSIIYPSGNRIVFGYGRAGQVESLSLAATNGQMVPLLFDIKYRPFGPVASWRWGNSTTTSPRIYERQYDTQRRLVSYPLGELDNGGVTRTLQYDVEGRITAATHHGSAASALENQRYYYDDLDRLISFDAAGMSHTYSYDKNGNRTQTQFGASTHVYTISQSSNRLSAVSGPNSTKIYTYDASGNITGDGTASYMYDGNRRLNSARHNGVTTTYRYNGLGERVVKSTLNGDTTYYVYDEQGLLLGEYDKTGSVNQETVYLGNLPVAVLTRPGEAGFVPSIHNVFADHLNTPRIITRADDSKIIWRWDRADPFGIYQPETISISESGFSYNPRFPGQVYDSETSLHYNYFRDYDPLTGRYIQSDPTGLAGGTNTYGYVEANPLSFVDPLGLVKIPFYIKDKSVVDFARNKAKEFGFDLNKCSDSQILDFVKYVPQSKVDEFQASYDSRPDKGTQMTPNLRQHNEREIAKEKAIIRDLLKGWSQGAHSCCLVN